MTTPRVSVVVPCYNSAAYLGEAVDSVVAQIASDIDIEMVLVDDGSTDGTPALIGQLAARYPAIVATRQANQGVAGARNRGISLSRGAYVVPLDADDLLAPTMVESCARILDAEPEVSVVFPDREDFGALTGIVRSGTFALAKLKYFNQLPYCAMFRRQMWQALGGYRCNVSGFDDWDFWLAAAARGFRGHHLALPMLRHRRYAGSQLGRIIGDYERLFATIILNNREVYAAEDVTAASAYLATGKEATLLRWSRRIFERGYPAPGC